MNKVNTLFIRAIISAWLIVGTLDLAAAMIQTLIYKGSILKLLQFIASGVFGADAFSGGVMMAVYGTLFHYGIAFIWTLIAFVLYPGFTLVAKNRILAGMVYGVLVWSIMNLIVLPLSNIPQRQFEISKAFLAAVILIIAVGLPLSFLTHRYYQAKFNE